MEREQVRLTVMVTPFEERSLTIDESMPGEEIVIEHRAGAATKRTGREKFELDLDPMFFRESMTEVPERTPVLLLVQDSGSPDKDKEFNIIVRLIRPIGTQHAAFSATVAATEDDALEETAGKEGAQTGAHIVADGRKLKFEIHVSIEGVTIVHAAR